MKIYCFSPNYILLLFFMIIWNHFKPLSANLIMVVEKFGINQQVYSQFCPMADGNKGGSWLTLDDKVLNPYYGIAMLTCGEVTKTIK